MATQTFKIGLSNTDKQNMAQDVYERILALTFQEYDSAEEYNVGDFVVYNDQLYKCIGATTGAWDSTKWQLATLDDLVTDIEGAVAFVNDKANVDGNYPTMTVGAAENLTPYSEESGTDQEEPFLLQGTGCGNGEQQVDTGALGLLKEKQGNTVVVNQLAKALNDDNWGEYNCSVTFVDSVATVTATQQDGLIIQGNVSYIAQHKYIAFAQIKLTTPTDAIRIRVASGYGDFYTQATTDWQLVIGVCTVTVTTINNLQIGDIRASDWDAFQVKNVGLIDLTQWFGSNDNIPAHLLAHPEDFFRYYQGSLAYNESELVNANGRYLKAIGRQQWDEVVVNGYYDENGQPVEYAEYCRNANFIKVVPGLSYYLYKTSAGSCNIYYYDKDKQFIKSITGIRNHEFTIPDNCCYINFKFAGATYNHDITISIYYEGESGYDQYYPYEELANIDTGSEILRSAGSVKDYKTPDGTITRRVGTYTFTGSESWAFNEGNQMWVFDIPQASAKTLGSTLASNGILFVIYQNAVRVYLSDNPQLTISTNMNDIFPSGTAIHYELAEPTTEQGTTFSENVAIDDFGSMDFGGTNGVPQGNLIFYAVDYKAFVDSLYNTLDGDATDIVKESELDSKLATLGYVKLTSVSGYDATKTQVLKNVEGTLTWVTEGE